MEIITGSTPLSGTRDKIYVQFIGSISNSTLFLVQEGFGIGEKIKIGISPNQNIGDLQSIFFNSTGGGDAWKIESLVLHAPQRPVLTFSLNSWIDGKNSITKFIPG